MERYAELGLVGLRARSHRPHRSPQSTTEEVEILILVEHKQRRAEGARKLRCILEIKHGLERPSVCGTVAEMLAVTA